MEKGLAGGSYSDLSRVGASWYWKWCGNPTDGQTGISSSDLAHSEYVPMLWEGLVHEDLPSSYDGDILFMNEPDCPSQLWISPETAVDRYVTTKAYYSNARIIFGGCWSEWSDQWEYPMSYDWVDAALDYMDQEEIDFPEAWHLHIYMYGGGDETKWENFLEMIDVINTWYGHENTPIWVTEFGCGCGELDTIFKLYTRLAAIPQVKCISPWLAKASDDVQEEDWWPKYGNNEPWPVDYGRLIDSSDDLITAAGYLFKNYQNQITGEDGMLTRIIHEDFFGDSIDTRWNIELTGTGSVALKTDPPHRIECSSGSSSGGIGMINEGNFYKFDPSDAVTLIVRARLNSISDVMSDIGFFSSGNSHRAYFRFSDSSSYWQILAKNSSGETSQNIQVAEANEWILLEMVLTNEILKARIDGGSIAEVDVNLPTDNLRFKAYVYNTANSEKVLGLDYVTILPGYAAF